MNQALLLYRNTNLLIFSAKKLKTKQSTSYLNPKAWQNYECREKDTYYENYEITDTIEQTAEELSYANFPCGHCEYAATDGANLKKHIEAKHLGVRYLCELCHYQATQKQNLKRHYKLKHSSRE